MKLKLHKVGNSSALLVTRDMKRYLGLDSEEIELDYVGGKVVIQKPETPAPYGVKELAMNTYMSIESKGGKAAKTNISEIDLAGMKARYPFLKLFDDVPEKVIDMIEADIKKSKREGLPNRA